MKSNDRRPARPQFGGGQTTAQVTAATRTQLTVVVPADATTGPVSVQTEGGTATSPASFEVIFPPVISDFNPKSGNVASIVTVTGIVLNPTQGETTVTFAGAGASRINGCFFGDANRCFEPSFRLAR